MSRPVPLEMRAVVYNSGSPKTVTRKVPKSLRGHLVVQVAAAGVNPVDAKDVMGDKLPGWGWVKGCNRWCISTCTPGFDFSGTAAEDCPAAHIARGDKVYGTMPPLKGSFSEYVSVPLDQVARMPANLSFEEAACLPLVGLTALQSLRHRVAAGSRVLIIGASGGSGHIAVQVAKALGAARVVGVCSARNAAFLQSLGADAVLDYTSGDVVELAEADTAVHGAFTTVLDCVSSGEARDAAFRYEERIRPRRDILAGDYVRLGGYTSDWCCAGLKRVVGVNCFSAGRELFWVRFPKSSGELDTLRRWAEEGRIKVQVSKRYPLTGDGAASAFDDLLSRRVQGKIVLLADPSSS